MRRVSLVAASSMAWSLAVVALNGGGALSCASAWCRAAISRRCCESSLSWGGRVWRASCAGSTNEGSPSRLAAPSSLGASSCHAGDSEIKSFITQYFGGGSWEDGKEVASDWGVPIFRIAFSKDMWVLRAAVGNMILARAFSLSFIQFSNMMCHICWKAEKLALGETGSDYVLHPLEAELLGIVMAMNLIGGDDSKFAWATRSSLFDEDSSLSVAHVLMFCMLTALANPRTREQCLEGDPFLAACFYGAYFLGAVLVMSPEDLVTLAVVGDYNAYRPVVAFMKRMQDGLGQRFIPNVMALLWKAYHEDGWTVRVRVETLRPVPLTWSVSGVTTSASTPSPRRLPSDCTP